MFKKIFITTVLLITTSITFAAAPYIGTSIGVNNTDFHLDETWMGTTFDNISGTKPNLNIFGGYGGVIANNIYLGGEVFFNETLGTMNASSLTSTPDYPTSTSLKYPTTSLDYPTSTSEYPASTSVEYQTRHSYGVNLIPGIMLSSSTMLYGRVGIVRTHFETTVTNIYGSENDTADVTGTQGGLGLQTSLSTKVELRGEYVYTKYRSFTTDGLESNPTANQFNIGLVYKFL
jgi:opacity protein-like surface antigen